ncbi:MAG: chemotaxis response regulator protein-glutamate methylesterase [Acidobacteriota bacterium]|nr:chemotaxis response regulator protein-glutamate methylesterase [Acidobacteriota bacterium]
MNGKKVIRVLVVDDSALVRKVLAAGLDMDPGIKVVGTASDPFVARDMIVRKMPNVLTLDVEMPRMDGVDFLRKLMPQFPLPVVMVSALTQRGKQITIEALEAGAVDFVTKPSSNLEEGLNAMMQELRTKVKIASMVNVSHWKSRKPAMRPKNKPRALAESTDKVVAVGASTGGTEAIREVLSYMPANMPGTVVVQHMPPGFTRMFAERLNQQCAAIVKEAESGDRIMPGRVLIAPGDKHMRVKRRGGIYEVVCEPGLPVMGHCPSVEVMMQSVAAEVGANAVGVMLTGMGRDGCTGLLAMRQAGASTIVQDESTCVVFGMPKEARDIGAAQRVLPLSQIGTSILRLVK